MVKSLNDQIAKHETYRTIATAAANKTYKAQITDLSTAFNGLSYVEKLKSVLLVGETIIRYYGSNSYFSATHNSSSAKVTTYSYFFNETPRIDKNVIESTGSITHTTISDDTNANTISLLVVD